MLDLSATPLLALHQPPQGYFHAADEAALVAAVLQLRESVGEFEKPKFFDYKQKICAHSRNEQIGCTACIDVCSAQAIRSDASRKGKAGGATLAGIIVEPHLCVGCGACTTVCPSGAISYATPRADHQGRRIRTLLRHLPAGRRHATRALLIHSQAAGAQLIDELGRAARTDAAVRGVPARVLPLDVWHTASVGIDLWLSAIAFGASQVWVLMTDEEAPDYRARGRRADGGRAGDPGRAGLRRRALAASSRRAMRARSTRRCSAAPAQSVKQAAPPSRVQADKRGTLDLAIEHLLRRRAPRAPEAIALPAAGSPFGSLIVDTDRCTMCLSCVSACPEAALADNADKPQLRFIEKNCVQCGLCASTCPEDAITLEPRLWLADAGKARKQARVLNEVEPYRCIRCAKPFGTLKAIEADGRQARRAPDVPGRARRAAAHVRRLPRDRHPHQPRRSQDHRCLTPPVAMQFGTPDDREEIARAEVYGLLARAVHRAAERRAATSSSRSRSPRRRAPARSSRPAGPSWSRPRAACRARRWSASTPRCSAASASPRSSCTARGIIAGSLNEKPLVDLRSDLAALGLERAGRRARDRGPHRQPVRDDALPDRRRRRRASATSRSQQRFFGAHLRRGSSGCATPSPAHPRARLLPRGRRLHARFLRASRRRASTCSMRSAERDACRGLTSLPAYAYGQHPDDA